jgi:hypothetical protein
MTTIKIQHVPTKTWQNCGDQASEEMIQRQKAKYFGFPDDFHGQVVTKLATRTRIFRLTPALPLDGKVTVWLSRLGMREVIRADRLEEQRAGDRNFDYPWGFERRTVFTTMKAALEARGLDYRGREI